MIKKILHSLIIQMLFISAISAAGIEQLSPSGSYRFDDTITHGWENEVRGDFRINPGLSLNATLHYLDATQDAISGITTLRGQIMSGLLGVQWRTLSNYLFIDAQAGVDGVVDYILKPRGALKLDIKMPIPANPVLQNVKLTPQAWYTHSMFNGPAIKNRIASYGYSAELGWSMGPKMAAAVNFRQGYMKPENKMLDSAFTPGVYIDIPGVNTAPTYYLDDNVSSSFYAYMYHQVLKFLYLGYSYSWSDWKTDRHVLTYFSTEFIGMPGMFSILEQYNWAYYPYPTPKNMKTHAIIATFVANLGGNINLKAKSTFPFYSIKEIRYLPGSVYTIYNNAPLDDNSNYMDCKEEKYTGPLTIGGEININIASKTSLSFVYDYFGFPYEKWAYFNPENSYSLHTFSLKMKYGF